MTIERVDIVNCINKITIKDNEIQGRGFNYRVNGDRLKIECPQPFHLLWTWFVRPSLSGKTDIYPHIQLRHLNAVNSQVEVETQGDSYVYVDSRGSDISLKMNIRNLHLECRESKIQVDVVKDLVATLNDSHLRVHKLINTEKIFRKGYSTYSAEKELQE